jgi:RNA polymerase-binding transcription factor DksA
VDAELIADAESDLSAVEAALARLDEGTYGLCDVCGGRIDDSVLADDPVALRCRDCGVGAPAPDPGWTSAATPAEE